VHKPIGFNLLVRKASVTRVRAVKAAQRPHIERAQAFFIGTDDAVLETVEPVAGGIDCILDQLDFGRVGPAAFPLKLGSFARIRLPPV
jgi:hypothetical protein